jgi:hypothetical protein
LAQPAPHIPLAFVAGLIFAVVIAGLDGIINPFANADIIGEMTTEGNPFMQLLLAYCTATLLLGWGFMSLFAWPGSRVLERERAHLGLSSRSW